MKMERSAFVDLYEKARQQRAKHSTFRGPSSPRPLLDAFFKNTLAHPPVIGFGLPNDRVGHPLVVTVGINPSTKEFTGSPPPLPLIDDPAAQWDAQTAYFRPSSRNRPNESWFGLAARFLRSSCLVASPGTESCSPYSEGLAVHLDLSPLVTSAFGDVYSKLASNDAEAAAVEMLRDGVRGALVPALRAILARNEIATIVIFGFNNESPGDSPMANVLKGQFIETKKLSRDSLAQLNGASAVWAKPLPAQLSVLFFGEFSSIPFVLVSQGPSYWKRQQVAPTTIDAIGRAVGQSRQ
jgi:hypothetical protein